MVKDKANLLELVFFKGKVKEERKRAATHEKADDEDELVYQGPNCPPCPKYIVELAEQAHARMEARGQSCIVSVTEDVEVPLWRAIKAHLPEARSPPRTSMDMLGASASWWGYAAKPLLPRH